MVLPISQHINDPSRRGPRVKGQEKTMDMGLTFSQKKKKQM